MFERFTPEARRIVTDGVEIAQHLHHDFLGTEHLLIALADTGPNIASCAPLDRRRSRRGPQENRGLVRSGCAGAPSSVARSQTPARLRPPVHAEGQAGDRAGPPRSDPSGSAFDRPRTRAPRAAPTRCDVDPPSPRPAHRPPQTPLRGRARSRGSPSARSVSRPRLQGSDRSR
jgi:hypothetical protein